MTRKGLQTLQVGCVNDFGLVGSVVVVQLL